MWPDLRSVTIRLDRAPMKMGATPIEVRPDGYRVYRGVAAFGDVVLDYPEFGRSEFVPAEVALSDEAIRSTFGVPFTIIHPDDLLQSTDEETIKQKAEGSVIRAVANWDARPPELVVEVMVLTASAQEAVESGEVSELSLGYRAEDAPKAGNFGGKPYQVVQARRLANHLSGVRRARSGTADGRRARLDEADADGPYARGSMLKNGETDPTDTAIDLDALRLDEGPPVVVSEEVDADAPPEVEAEAVEVAPSDPGAEALAGFSAEAAEILKTLPPEDLAHLMMLVKGAVAEQAVMAAPLAGTPTLAEVEVEDNQAPGPKTTALLMADATTPMAPQGLTADAVQKMIADALAMHGGAKKTDAAQTPATTAKAKPTAARVDEAEVAKQIKESRRLDAEFVGVARKDGHVREDSATVTQAATAMYGVIAECLPLLKEAAKTHIKNGRRDAFLEIYRQAEDIRRARLLDDQTSIFAQFHAAPGDQSVAASRLDSFGRPGAAG